MSRPLILAVLALALAALAGADAAAETLRARYRAAVLGVVVLGEASIQGAVLAGRYSAGATVETAGLAALFDDTRIRASSAGTATPAGLAWVRYDLTHAYAAKSRRVAMRRAGATVAATITPTYRDWGDPPASDAQKGASFDPVTALIAMSRGVAARNACSGAVLVFDGRGHYRLSLSGGRRARFSGGGYSGDALVCTLRYAPIAGFKPMTAEERARIPVGEMWFGAAQHGFAPPLRIEVPTPLGAPLRVELIELRLSP